MLAVAPARRGASLTLTRTFEDPLVAGAGFGYSPALDRNNVLLGDPFDGTNGPDVVRAHVFDAISGDLRRTFDMIDSRVAGSA